MAIDKMSNREVKAQLRRVRRAKRDAKRSSGRSSSSRGNRKNVSDLQEIADGLPESTAVESQEDRGDAEMEEEELKSRLDLLQGKL